MRTFNRMSTNLYRFTFILPFSNLSIVHLGREKFGRENVQLNTWSQEQRQQR